MLELPEVETIRTQLGRVLPKLTIKNVEVRSRRVFLGEGKSLIGKKISGLRRFAKVLVIDLSGGLSIAVHLKMTGRLVFEKFKVKSEKLKVDWDVDYPTDKHTHVVFTFTNDDKLYFHDQRKFGWVKVLPTDQVEQMAFVKNLGPEPLRNLKLEAFKQIVRRGTRPIKLLLMDQQKLSGVGNIYANEALWCAKIHPNSRASRLDDTQATTLFHCLEQVLTNGIKWQGASENNYRDAFGGKGQVQEHFLVYSRQDEPCVRCHHLVRKFTLGGRGTYYCPICQPG